MPEHNTAITQSKRWSAEEELKKKQEKKSIWVGELKTTLLKPKGNKKE